MLTQGLSGAGSGSNAICKTQCIRLPLWSAESSARLRGRKPKTYCRKYP